MSPSCTLDNAYQHVRLEHICLLMFVCLARLDAFDVQAVVIVQCANQV